MHARTLRAVLDIEIDLDAVPDFDPAVLDLAAIESLPPAKRRAVKHMIDKVRFIAAGYDRPLLFEAASDRRNTGRLCWQAAVEADMQQKTRTGKHDCAQWARDMLTAPDFLAACNEKGVELPDSPVTVARHISRILKTAKPKAARRLRKSSRR